MCGCKGFNVLKNCIFVEQYVGVMLHTILNLKRISMMVKVYSCRINKHLSIKISVWLRGVGGEY